jgi:hypothetical protein
MKICTHPRSLLLTLALLALGGALARGADEIEWKSFTSEEGRFTAKFPGEAVVEKKPNAIHTHASPPGVDADFRVAYTDREAADANLEAAFKELDRIRAKTCEGQGIKAENELNYLFAGRPATQFDFTKQVGEAKAFYRMRFIMDGKRFYQVLYGYEVDKPMLEQGEFFYKSFKIAGQ